MRLMLNGEGLDTGADTVGELLEALGIKPGGVAVEVNMNIVNKKDYTAFRLKEDDRVEVVNFVGGG